MSDPSEKTAAPGKPVAARASAPAPAAASQVTEGGGEPETVPADDGRAAYRVTGDAGPRVAGRRAEKGDTLRLTEEEARSELLTGAIVPKGGRTTASDPA